MKVFIVTKSFMDSVRIHDVFSTKEKAEECVKQLEESWGTYPFETQIIEIEVK